MQVFDLPPIIRQIQDELNAMRGRLDSLESVGEKGQRKPEATKNQKDNPPNDDKRDV